MLNILAKALLVLTSLSPVSFVLAVNQFERGITWTIWVWPLATSLFLAFLCHLLLRYVKGNAERHLFRVKDFERKDQEMLTFLFVYLLPFLRGATFASEWITSIVILIIITAAIAHVGAFHFNPVMRVFGYRFYAVRDVNGLSNLLISKVDLRRSGVDIQTVRLASDVYLRTENTDV